ncbi:YfhO family protein [Altibacter sp. HG106]|uniref:YfhO family protein n=1 Tax=Altibacter sp. HG106 TaxID=3023937 RepID=UPI00234FE21E|nr:YfhO family protein [Altibacter sp. HG106]MDC7993672.1 YfhO family protein [Altibacter sp. HG106]
MPTSIKKLLPHLIVVLLFVLIALLFFSPVLQGKVLLQSDIVQYTGMSKQQKDIAATTGEEAYWTDAAFGGMPTYQLGAKYPHNYIKELDLAIRILPRPADYLLLYFVGMYLLFLVLKIDYKLAFLGALAFGFSTYLIIILGVGHNAKAHAIAYMPLVLSGILLTFRKKYFYGFLLTSVALALELVANHIQMTYYLLLLVICIGVAYGIDAFRKQQLKHYFTAIGIMAVGAVIALGLNATNLMATKEYADTSTRGQSELTLTAEGVPKENSNGLDYEYITQYSYGLWESFNLFIPNFMGGGSADPLPENSETVETLLRMGASPQEAQQLAGQVPAYWGDQPIVAAPAYIGAVVIFLSVLALFLIKGRLRWWIVTAFVLSLLLSWGKNFNFLTELFIDTVPLYNKFRAVSSIQVIIELILPVLAVVGLHQYFNDFVATEKRKKALLWATGIAGGTAMLFLVGKHALLDFASPYDALFREQLGAELVEAIRTDRATLLTQDAIRTLVLVLLAATVLWFHLKGKIKQSLTILLLAVLICFDLIGVDRRYVTNDDFVSKRVMEAPFQETGADTQILADTDGHFRVFDATTDAFNSGRASYYHKALGGYHAAKPGRMSDLYDFYLSEGDVGILNMMNVRYIITQNQNGGPVAQRNPYANGNAWFVENAIIAANADEEIRRLDSLDTKQTAVVHQSFESMLPERFIAPDSTASIELTSYLPNKLVYETKADSPQMAVFSEVFYPHGWKVTIDGKPTDYYRANYALRAMTIPAGVHQVVFTFEPEVIQTGSTISLVSTLLFVLIAVGGVVWWFKRNKTEHPS